MQDKNQGARRDSGRAERVLERWVGASQRRAVLARAVREVESLALGSYWSYWERQGYPNRQPPQGDALVNQSREGENVEHERGPAGGHHKVDSYPECTVDWWARVLVKADRALDVQKPPNGWYNQHLKPWLSRPQRGREGAGQEVSLLSESYQEV